MVGFGGPPFALPFIGWSERSTIFRWWDSVSPIPPDPPSKKFGHTSLVEETSSRCCFVFFCMKKRMHQRGEELVPQGLLPFKYEKERSEAGMTGLGGLPLYLDLAAAMKLEEMIERHLKVREGGQGWTDSEMVMSIILLNLAGGDHVSDIRVLESDDGFGRILRRITLHGLPRKKRGEIERRWRKEKKRAVPSESVIFRYLAEFHDSQQEKQRQPGVAFIPKANQHLQGLPRVCKELVEFAQRLHEERTATLDMDATLVETQKIEALYCYKHFKAYQPLNTYWAEQGLTIHTEFRDGNVPAGYQQKRVLEEVLEQLPPGVEKVRLRSDSAGYQHELMRFCQENDSRFGRIEFSISCDVTPDFKRAVAEVKEGDWKPLMRVRDGEAEKTDREWAEVCFAPNKMATSRNAPTYRYLATRELMKQQPLPGMASQLALPFPTMEIKKQQYKVFGIVTNRDLEGNELINWHSQRCGKSEEAHSVMKQDLAGGHLPSGDFGENAAWWWIMVLASNLDVIMKRLVLGQSWATTRLKAIRFHLINLPGRVINHARGLIIRISKDHPSFSQLVNARRQIASFALSLPGPSG
jgi:hypothetical protein